MKEVKTILSIDLGKTCGVAVSINGEIEHAQEYVNSGLFEFNTFVKEMIILWRPDVILIPYPTRFYYVIIAHAKLMGIVEAEAEKRNITVIEVQDSTCKKVVLGRGNAKKEDIAIYYSDKYPSITSGHILDSIMFVDWFLKSA